MRHAAQPLQVPRTPLAELVLAKAAARGTRAALIDSQMGRAIGYSELPALVERAAASLPQLGVWLRHVLKDRPLS